MIGSATRLEEAEVTTLTTPAGSPASASRRVKYRVVSGVSCEGLITTVHPTARAGPILRVAIAKGKFHGVTRNEGPTGRRETIIWPVPSGSNPYRPWMRTASSLNQRRNSPP